MKIANSAKNIMLLASALFLFSSASHAQETSQQKQNQAPPKVQNVQSPAAIAPSSQEDWTSLGLQTSSLTMKPPRLAYIDDVQGTGFIRERYEVTWRARDPFDLYVIRPRGVVHTPVILYLNSFPEDTDQFKDNTWCETVVSGGYTAIGFVGAITGHRNRYRFAKEWFVSEMQESLAS